jgi:hypothetical protein
VGANFETISGKKYICLEDTSFRPGLRFIQFSVLVCYSSLIREICKIVSYATSAVLVIIAHINLKPFILLQFILIWFLSSIEHFSFFMLLWFILLHYWNWQLQNNCHDIKIYLKLQYNRTNYIKLSFMMHYNWKRDAPNAVIIFPEHINL